MKNKCRFCEILENKHENDTYIISFKYGSLFLNLNQHYEGRCLYILNDHHEHFHAMDKETYFGFNSELKKVGKVINDLFKPDLINYALLGNHIQHVHWHIIPRYKNDDNWGGPPWPSKIKNLTVDEYKKVSKKIRKKFKGTENGKNQISRRATIF